MGRSLSLLVSAKSILKVGTCYFNKCPCWFLHLTYQIIIGAVQNCCIYYPAYQAQHQAICIPNWYPFCYCQVFSLVRAVWVWLYYDFVVIYYYHIILVTPIPIEYRNCENTLLLGSWPTLPMPTPVMSTCGIAKCLPFCFGCNHWQTSYKSTLLLKACLQSLFLQQWFLMWTELSIGCYNKIMLRTSSNDKRFIFMLAECKHTILIPQSYKGLSKVSKIF